MARDVLVKRPEIEHPGDAAARNVGWLGERVGRLEALDDTSIALDLRADIVRDQTKKRFVAGDLPNWMNDDVSGQSFAIGECLVRRCCFRAVFRAGA